jgi:hypothetical protein
VNGGTLRGTVNGCAGVRHETRHGGGVDDMPALTVFLDARQDSDDAVDGSP